MSSMPLKSGFSPLLEEFKTPTSTHPMAISLLKLFLHVFSDEIPLVLPPKKSIQHHIDLISRAILPNKPAYNMYSKETTEIQRQVDELISKGLVRESLSPCAILALLVAKKDEHAHVCG